MIEILRHRSFRRLFLAQVVALVGTGLATVALALLAYDLAGANAGAVLGTALAIKMIAYVTLAPVAGALIPPARRKVALIAFDLIRASVALALPFVTEVWQVYLLIFLLQSASAGFTPLFQSLIPEILTAERDYTRALSLSRLAYDLESLLSPALAAALLTVISFHGLFAGTSLGFLLSASLVLSTAFPVIVAAAASDGPYARALRGMRIYLRTPRLRGLLALNLAAAAAGSMVFVNTVVIVRVNLAQPESAVALALACFGGGSMLAAFALPWWLDRRTDRQVMTSGSLAAVLILSVLALAWPRLAAEARWTLLLAGWALLGCAYASIVTPGGRLLRRSADAASRPALFAAQFSLSHACWLLTYPLVGWLGATAGIPAALWAMTGLAALGTLLAWRLWPADDPIVIEHAHDDLSPGHPHLAQHQVGGRHQHEFHIDDLHSDWPER
ncbi:MAG: MFS transporter [Xanthomonadales bacterium PRO6]|nr:MFS transporter [Xanthomonadales bacterium PRO6]